MLVKIARMTISMSICRVATSSIMSVASLRRSVGYASRSFFTVSTVRPSFSRMWAAISGTLP